MNVTHTHRVGDEIPVTQERKSDHVVSTRGEKRLPRITNSEQDETTPTAALRKGQASTESS